MPTIAHYEVYTLEDTGWVLHARYVNSEKTRALDEARALETYLGRPTKVMRESYDPETNRYGEQTVFLSPKAVELRRRQRDRLGRDGNTGPGPGGDADWGRPTTTSGPVRAGFRPNVQMPAGFDQFAGRAQTTPGADNGRTRFGGPTHARSTGDLLARILFVLIASLVVATAGAATILVVINMLRGFDVVIDTRSLSSSVFSAFMILVVLTGVVLTLRVVPLQGVATTQKRRRRPPRTDEIDSAPPEPPAATGDGRQAPAGSVTGPGDGGAEDDPNKNKTEKDIEKEKQKKENERETEKARKKKENLEEAEKEKEKEKEKRQQSMADQDAERSNADDDASPAEPTPDPPPTPAFQSGHATTMAFLSAYVAALKNLRPKLDPYNRFGINLYLAGVCEVVAHTQSLSQEEVYQLLRETVEVMGTHATQAASFVERLDSYLVEDRYAQMVRCGREAMTLYQSEHQSGADTAFASLGMVLEDWNTPKTQKISGSTIAIVFTDMVGSTDLTSEHGDVKAQQILRAHNAAVRSALARFNGREIKHTGDGIMATFEHIPDAVWSMIDVLKAVHAHNQAETEIPLRIRIGINAGEPISAENDYYGLAVTVAARVCAKADMDEIIVTQIVRDMCEGTKLVFEDRGTFLLKGIKDPQRLHEAVWDGAPSRRWRVDSTASGVGPDGEGPQDSDPNAGPAALPSQPGGGRDRPGGATIDPDADGWVDPSSDADVMTTPDGIADTLAEPGAAAPSGVASTAKVVVESDTPSEPVTTSPTTSDLEAPAKPGHHTEPGTGAAGGREGDPESGSLADTRARAGKDERPGSAPPSARPPDDGGVGGGGMPDAPAAPADDALAGRPEARDH